MLNNYSSVGTQIHIYVCVCIMCCVWLGYLFIWVVFVLCFCLFTGKVNSFLAPNFLVNMMFASGYFATSFSFTMCEFYVLCRHYEINFKINFKIRSDVNYKILLWGRNNTSTHIKLLFIWKNL